MQYPGRKEKKKQVERTTASVNSKKEVRPAIPNISNTS
jgi:hypothetical protein